MSAAAGAAEKWEGEAEASNTADSKKGPYSAHVGISFPPYYTTYYNETLVILIAWHISTRFYRSEFSNLRKWVGNGFTLPCPRACLFIISYIDLRILLLMMVMVWLELLCVNIGWRMEMRGTYCDSSRHVETRGHSGQMLWKSVEEFFNVTIFFTKISLFQLRGIYSIYLCNSFKSHVYI